MCGFRNLWVCVFVDFVLCGCDYLWILLCVGVLVIYVFVFVFTLFFLLFCFLYIFIYVTRIRTTATE